MTIRWRYTVDSLLVVLAFTVIVWLAIGHHQPPKTIKYDRLELSEPAQKAVGLEKGVALSLVKFRSSSPTIRLQNGIRLSLAGYPVATEKQHGRPSHRLRHRHYHRSHHGVIHKELANVRRSHHHSYRVRAIHRDHGHYHPVQSVKHHHAKHHAQKHSAAKGKTHSHHSHHGGHAKSFPAHPR